MVVMAEAPWVAVARVVVATGAAGMEAAARVEAGMVGAAQVAARVAVGTVAGVREAGGRAVAVMEEVDTVVVAAKVRAA